MQEVLRLGPPDLEHDLGLLQGCRQIGCQRGARGRKGLVRDAGREPRAGLDHDRLAEPDELLHRLRRRRDPGLVTGFGRHGDAHVVSSPADVYASRQICYGTLSGRPAAMGGGVPKPGTAPPRYGDQESCDDDDAPLCEEDEAAVGALMLRVIHVLRIHRHIVVRDHQGLLLVADARPTGLPTAQARRRSSVPSSGNVAAEQRCDEADPGAKLSGSSSRNAQRRGNQGGDPGRASSAAALAVRSQDDRSLWL